MVAVTVKAAAAPPNPVVGDVLYVLPPAEPCRMNVATPPHGKAAGSRVYTVNVERRMGAATGVTVEVTVCADVWGRRRAAARKRRVILGVYICA